MSNETAEAADEASDSESEEVVEDGSVTDSEEAVKDCPGADDPKLEMSVVKSSPSRECDGDRDEVFSDSREAEELEVTEVVGMTSSPNHSGFVVVVFMSDLSDESISELLLEVVELSSKPGFEEMSVIDLANCEFDESEVSAIEIVDELETSESDPPVVTGSDVMVFTSCELAKPISSDFELVA